MQNVVMEKFHNDHLRNDRFLGNGKSDNNKKKNKNNARSTWRHVSGSNNNNKKNYNNNNHHHHNQNLYSTIVPYVQVTVNYKQQ